MNCTWEGCSSPAKHPQTAKDGQIWASLCDAHNVEMDRGLTDVRLLVSNWIKAQGGAQKAAARMMNGFKR